MSNVITGPKELNSQINLSLKQHLKVPHNDDSSTLAPIGDDTSNIDRFLIKGPDLNRD